MADCVMRGIRRLRSISFTRVTRILIGLFVSCFCLLGLKTFMSVEDISEKQSFVRHEDISAQVETLEDSPRKAPKLLLKKYNSSKYNPEDVAHPVDLIESEDDNVNILYPGLREDPNDGKDTVLELMAKPAVNAYVEEKPEKIEGKFISGGQVVRPFPPIAIEETAATVASLFQYANPGRAGDMTGGIVHQAVQANQQYGLPLQNPQPNFALIPFMQRPNHNGSAATNTNINIPNGMAFNQNPARPLDPQPYPSHLGYGGVPLAWTNPTPPPLFNVKIQEKLVHFDLKGAPPKVSFYKAIFPYLRKLGATGLLMEYEDMFPFSGRLKPTRAKNAYSRADIVHINQMAAENDLYVIPLVQTFGHLEFVLKHEEFREFREVDAFVSVVCPSRNGTFQLVTEMIRQTMALHPNSTYLHIGADEVYHIGQCPICSPFLTNDTFMGKNVLFLSYVSQILSHVRETYPGVRAIMWDDMFHSMEPATIKMGLGDLANYVEPMIWSYFTDWSRHLPLSGDLYGPIFPNIWGATAFKGSDGETRQIPDIRTQVAVHTSWIDALRFNGGKLKNFRGMAISGWSRYDHFMPLCELFPVGFPSLAINLEVLNYNNFTVEGMEHAAKVMDCKEVPSTLDFVNYDPLLQHYSSCEFPGVEIFRVVQFIEGLKKPLKDYFEELEGKYPEYQMRESYVQSWRVAEHLEKLSAYEALYQSYSSRTQKAFQEIYDDSTYNEWVAANMVPIVKKLLAWKEIFSSAQKMSAWPSRPLPIQPMVWPTDLATSEAALDYFLPKFTLPPPLHLSRFLPGPPTALKFSAFPNTPENRTLAHQSPRQPDVSVQNHAGVDSSVRSAPEMVEPETLQRSHRMQPAPVVLSATASQPAYFYRNGLQDRMARYGLEPG